MAEYPSTSSRRIAIACQGPGHLSWLYCQWVSQNTNQVKFVGTLKEAVRDADVFIGVSAAKGLSFALDIPLISVSTLQALAKQVKISNGVIIPMLDARRLEVYSAIFDANYNTLRNIEAQIIDAEAYSDYLNNGKVYFIGNGVEKTKSLITHKNAIYIEDKLPSANEMGLIAHEKYKKNDIEDVAYFEPFYLKDFIVISS